MSDLPPGWERATVGEVGDVQLGRQRSPKNHAGAYMRPYLRAANVTWDGLNLDDVKEMNFAPGEAETFELATGDLLLNEASGSPNEVGKPGVWTGEIPGCCFQNTLLRVRTRGPSVRYLYWYFYNAALRGRFGQASRGVNIRHLGKAGLSRFPIPVPPAAEQERIVAAIEEHLSRLEVGFGELCSVRTRVDRFRQRCIDAALERFDEVRPLRSFATSDGITDGPFGSNLKTSHYTNQGPRVVRLQNIGRGTFLDEKCHISQEHFERLRKHEVQAGDLVVASLLSNGLRACVVPSSLGQAIVKADCIRVRPTAKVDARFLAYALMRSNLEDFVATRVRGVGRSRLGLKNIADLPIPDASPEEQLQLADLLDEQLAVAGRTAGVIKYTTRKAEGIRRAVLAAAFTGGLAPQDPKDMPAAMLLDRIRAERAADRPKPRRRRKVSS